MHAFNGLNQLNQISQNKRLEEAQTISVGKALAYETQTLIRLPLAEPTRLVELLLSYEFYLRHLSSTQAIIAYMYLSMNI